MTLPGASWTGWAALAVEEAYAAWRRTPSPSARRALDSAHELALEVAEAHRRAP